MTLVEFAIILFDASAVDTGYYFRALDSLENGKKNYFDSSYF